MNKRWTGLLAAGLILLSVSVRGETATVADCVRDDSLDVWASHDTRFCNRILRRVFESAGVEARRLPFLEDASFDAHADVIASGAPKSPP